MHSQIDVFRGFLQPLRQILDGLLFVFIHLARGVAQRELTFQAQSITQTGDGVLQEIFTGVFLLAKLYQAFIQVVQLLRFIYDILITPAGKKYSTLFGDIDDVASFIDGVIELGIHLAHGLVDFILALQPFD